MSRKLGTYQRWVAGFIVKRKSTLLLASFGVVFLCLDCCIAKIYGCGIIKTEGQPPTRRVADSKGQKNPPRWTANSRGGFSMSGLLCCKNIWMWYNKNRKTTAHKVGCRFKEERKSTPLPASFGVVFLCLDYLLNWNINVSNARINTPKAIRSLKS